MQARTFALTLSILSTLVVLPFQTQALEVRSGKYVQENALFVSTGSDGSQRFREPSFLITRSGNLLTFTDIKNDIKYELDLNNREEQNFPTSYFDFLKQRKGMGAIASTIKNITIGQVTETQDKITGNLNIYLESNSNFGSAKATVSLGTEITLQQCDELIENNSGNTQTIKIACLQIETGGQIGLSSLSMSVAGANPLWSPVLRNTVGLTLDLILKTMPLSLSSTLIRLPRG